MKRLSVPSRTADIAAVIMKLLRDILMGMAIAALTLIFCMLVTFQASADVITEFGMGVKIEGTTSVLLLPQCHLATIIETRPDTPRYDYLNASCGGDNPMFVGWPVAYEREFSGGIWRLRAGWFHYSNWFDGKQDRETHMDCACVTATFNWSKRK